MNPPSTCACRLTPSISALALVAGFALVSCSTPAAAQQPAAVTTTASATTSVRDWITRFDADRGSLERYFDVESSRAREERFRAFYDDSAADLARIDFEALDVDGRIDAWMMKHWLVVAKKQLDVRRKQQDEIAAFVPYAEKIAELELARRRLEPIDAEKCAETLESLRGLVERAKQAAVEAKDCTAKPLGLRAARTVADLTRALTDWYDFRAGYDPAFTWWVKKPYEALKKALGEDESYLRETIGGVRAGDETTIVGDPIGREALMVELEGAMIPYTPEELLEIAERELAWCTSQMLDASRAMGFGEDWKKALEKVKQDHVKPGEQPTLVRDLARQAIAFLKEHDLVTIPPLAEETWRMEMMSPEAQLQSPFFLGGEQIIVAFPTDGMTHEQKLMSMRGNNVHFAHATVFHELFPGHGLQQYYESRFNAHRGLFHTPFWTEGWALYWEMLLWDQGYSTTPEDRIGALFWRMHRCARIQFSLGFHLGTMTPQQCIDLLVDKIGHERDNAAAEVRRSLAGGYGPLYQCAYMIGGLQLRALHHDLVDSGKMTNRAFHDAVLQGNNMPIEMVRARLMGTKLAPDFQATWRFYDLSKH